MKRQCSAAFCLAVLSLLCRAQGLLLLPSPSPSSSPRRICAAGPRAAVQLPLQASATAAVAGTDADKRPSRLRKFWKQLRGKGDDYSRAELKSGIAKFYDSSSALWENMWGEHMHHGYYTPDAPPKNLVDHKNAQVRMVDEALAFAGLDDAASGPKFGVDVGCGIGGSSRYISRKFGTRMTGITLSPYQCKRAEQVTLAAGQDEKCKFLVADALKQPFRANFFDLVWSMESGEHMPNKQEFVNEIARVCAPDGRIIVVTWCHRDLEAGEASLNPKEERLLNRINTAYYLPRWCSVADYRKYFENAGLVDIKSEDWTPNVSYFWPAVIRSSFTRRGILGLLRSGPSTIRGAFAMFLMVRGFKMNCIKFGIITARKPAAT